MRTVGLFEAKTKLSELCAEVLRSGEKVIISRRGRPMVEIAPLSQLPVAAEESVWDVVKRLDHEFGDPSDEPGFEPPQRRRAGRDPLVNYWE